jgi:hypothetical protein
MVSIGNHRCSWRSGVRTLDCMHRRDLADLASELAADGFAGREAAVREVARAARAAGVAPVLVAVLTDEREPLVARWRAFGRVAAELAARDAERPADAALAA